MEKIKRNKIYLIYYGRFPSEKAHAIFLNKSAQAFVESNIQVEVLAAGRRTEHNLAQSNYTVTYIPTIDWAQYRFFKRLFFWLGYFLFSFRLHKYLKQHYIKGQIIYTNEYVPLLFLKNFDRVCLEIHDLPQKHLWFYRSCYKVPSHVLFTNQWKLHRFIELFPRVSAEKFVEFNGVDVSDFNIEISKEEARSEVGLPQDKKIVMYTGHLYSWKGVDILAEAARRLPDFLFVFVGGLPRDYQKFSERYEEVSNIQAVGFKSHTEIPMWQKAADILVLPNTAKKAISKYNTSPMKLFEYLASSRPVIASRIPSIEEVAQDESVSFFKADDPEDLSRVIVAVSKNQDETMRKVNTAFERVRRHSWKERAARILAYINK